MRWYSELPAHAHSRDGSGKWTAGTCEYVTIPEAHTASLDPPFSPSVEGSFGRSEVENAETTWVGPGIRSATTPPHSQSSSITTVEYGEIECGGQRYKSDFFYRRGTDLALDHDSWELVLDDGRRLMLDDRTGLVVNAGFNIPLCSDSSGIWRGSAIGYRDPGSRDRSSDHR